MNRTALAGAILWLAGSAAFAIEPQIDWTADYNGPGSDWDSVGDIVLHDGYLHVVGFSYVNYQRECVTVKYDPDGTELWSRIYQPYSGPNQPGEAHGVAVDGPGNVYVTGWTAQDSVTNYVDVTTLKYDPDGGLLWTRRFRVAGDNAQGEALALDPQGFLYIAGAAWTGSGFDVLLLKYDLDGNLLWSRTRGHPGNLWDSAFSLKLDGAGDIVLGGYTEPYVTDQRQLYLLKYREDGQFLWDWTELSGANDDQVRDLEIDAAGSVYAVGRFGAHLLVLKLSSSGGLLWQQPYSGGQAAGEYPAGIELAPDGSVYAATASWVQPSATAMVLLKYTSDGQSLWMRQENGGYADAICEDLTVDAHGGAYLTGYGFNQNNHEDYLTARYDAAGNRVWATTWSAPEDGTDLAYFVRVGDDSRVFVVGNSWRGLIPYYDIESVVYRQVDPSAVAASGGGTPFRLAPNPVIRGAQVQISRGGTGPVELYGIGGRRLLRLDAPSSSGAGDACVSFRAPSPGVYLLRSGKEIQRLVVLEK